MAQELKDQEKKIKYIHIDPETKEPRFVWSYGLDKKIKLDPEKIVGISMFNKDLKKIVNQDKIIFPEKTDRKKNSRKEKERKEPHYSQNDFNPEDEERSIIIDKLKDLVLKFEKNLDRYLDPQIPTGRKNRTLYLQQRELFAQNGFKEYIRAIRLKVIALCKYERKYRMDAFDVNIDGEVEKGWFLQTCQKALDEDDFHSAQEIVNSVEQIILEDQEVVPQRLVLTKIQ